MADVTSTNAVTGTATSKTEATKDSNALIATTDQFLTLLLAQLKHQDPLNPMEGTEFIDSITRLSSVEQDINQNKNLEEIASLLRNEDKNFGTPVSYLDRYIEFSSSVFNYDGEEGAFFYNLEEQPDEISIIIRDLEGDVVATDKGSTELGRNTFVWDGTDSNGNKARAGVYTVEITTNTRGEEPVDVESFTSGKVVEANFQGDDIVLVVGDISTTIEQITKIRSQEEQVVNTEPTTEETDGS